MTAAAEDRLSAEDAAFLADYDPSAFPHPCVAVDVCLLTILDSALHALVVRRAAPPFRGRPALPGVLLRANESLPAAAQRALSEKAGIEGVFCEQLYTFGEPRRDPRTRVLSVSYYALVPKERLPLRPGLDPVPYGWVRVAPQEEGPDRLVDESGETVRFAFDHEAIIRTALGRIRGKLTYTTIAFQLVPASFTLTELQAIYEVILCRRISKPAFRRKILAAEVVEATGAYRKGGHRPAKLYHFIRDDPAGEL